MHDKKFLELIPNVINCGFLAVSMSEIKVELLEIMNELISNLKSAFASKAAKLIIKNETVFSEFISMMHQEPKTIDDYVNSKKFLESDEYAKKFVSRQIITIIYIYLSFKICFLLFF